MLRDLDCILPLSATLRLSVSPSNSMIFLLLFDVVLTNTLCLDAHVADYYRQDGLVIPELLRVNS